MMMKVQEEENVLIDKLTLQNVSICLPKHLEYTYQISKKKFYLTIEWLINEYLIKKK